MIVEKVEKILSDGTKCVFRSATPEDAAEVLAEYKRIVMETDYSLSAPDEVSFTVESEREFLETYANNEEYLYLVAEIDGKIVGNVCFSPVGPQRRVCHRCTASIAIFKEFWGIGIGTMLMEIAVDRARNYGYEQIELSVAARNASAIGLYTKIGFESCGTIPRSFKYDDGSYDDEIFMIKQL